MFNGHKKGTYNLTQWALSSSLGFFGTQYTHTHLCNPVGPGQFCTLPSESLALGQRQQLNVSARHASAVVDILCSHVTTCQHVLPLLKAMHRICLLSWYYTYTIHLHQLAVDFHWCNTYHTQKSKQTLYSKVYHGSGRPSIFNDILMVSTHSCTMTQSTCAVYILKSTVPWYCFMSDMLLPYFLKLPCVPVRGRKLKIWYKEHIHNREYN